MQIVFFRFLSVIYKHCNHIFTKKSTIVLVLSAWIWSVLITLPTWFGWGDLGLVQIAKNDF